MNRTTEAVAVPAVGSHGSSPLSDARDIDLLLSEDLRNKQQRDNKGGTAIIRPLQHVEGVFYSIGVRAGSNRRGKENEEQKEGLQRRT